MEAQWRQGGRGRGRGRPGDELAARSGAAARPPAARGRGGARAAAAGTIGEGASGECRLLPSTRAAGPRAGELAVAQSPCRWRGRGCPRGREAGGPRPRSRAAWRCRAGVHHVPRSACRFLPGRDAEASAVGRSAGLSPCWGAQGAPSSSRSRRVKCEVIEETSVSFWLDTTRGVARCRQH